MESIFTKEELHSNEEAIRLLRSEYSAVHRLDCFDVDISALAGIVGALINILLVGIPQKGPDGLTGGSLSNYIRSYFDKKFPADEMQKLANSKESKVSFDGRSVLIGISCKACVYAGLQVYDCYRNDLKQKN